MKHTPHPSTQAWCHSELLGDEGLARRKLSLHPSHLCLGWPEAPRKLLSLNQLWTRWSPFCSPESHTQKPLCTQTGVATGGVTEPSKAGL